MGIGSGADGAGAVALQADGKIVAVGHKGDATNTTNDDFAAVRLQGDAVVVSTVVEFYNSTLHHYFITASAAEQASIDAGGSGPGWSRTGLSFRSGGSSRVCRFYGTPGVGPNSHFYTVEAAECAQVKLDPGWHYEGEDFSATPPGASQSCPSGMTQVYRVYNHRAAVNDSNHRYTISAEIFSAMVTSGWNPEGVVFCVPM